VDTFRRRAVIECCIHVVVCIRKWGSGSCRRHGSWCDDVLIIDPGGMLDYEWRESDIDVIGWWDTDCSVTRGWRSWNNRRGGNGFICRVVSVIFAVYCAITSIAAVERHIHNADPHESSIALLRYIGNGPCI